MLVVRCRMVIDYYQFREASITLAQAPQLTTRIYP